MAAAVHIKASFGNGATIAQMGKILEERMKYLHESARGSIAATAITILKSVRTVTKVAKKSKVKVDVVQDESIYPSFTTQGGRRKFCLRTKGGNNRINPEGTRVINLHRNEKKVLKMLHCYRFEDEGGKKAVSYIICAMSMAEAKNAAKNIKVRRAMRYAGLAKRAISKLMFKTNTKNVNDGALNPKVELKSDEVTMKREVLVRSGDGKTGKYGLILEDDLRYALNAVKGGKSTVDIQTRKAMNKVVSIINQKLKKSDDFFSPKKLPTPFPEVKSSKNK